MTKAFRVGELVLYREVVCRVCPPEVANSSFEVWVENPEKGYRHGVSLSSIRGIPQNERKEVHTG